MNHVLDDRLRKRIDRACVLLRQRGYVVVSPRRSSPESVLIAGPLVLNVATATLNYRGQHVQLPPFKFLLVQALMEAEGGWCNRRALRKLLWEQSDGSSDSLAVHMHHLRKKLVTFTGTDIIETSRLRGFRMALEKFDGALVDAR